jgi:hypothetical protein
LFGRIKGQAESALLQLSKDPKFASLRPFSARPAAVDPAKHEEIKAWIPKGALWKQVLGPPMIGVVKTFFPSHMSPTRELGKALVDLAMSDGTPLEGEGVSGEGRTISNIRFQKLAGI